MIYRLFTLLLPLTFLFACGNSAETSAQDTADAQAKYQDITVEEFADRIKYSKYTNNHIRNANLKVITQQFVDDLHPAWQRGSIDICNKCGGKEKPAPIYSTERLI